MSEWISAKERLPEWYGRYITFPNFYGRPDVAVYFPEFGVWKQEGVNGNIEVTDWQPLPAPPTGS